MEGNPHTVHIISRKCSNIVWTKLWNEILIHFPLFHENASFLGHFSTICYNNVLRNFPYSIFIAKVLKHDVLFFRRDLSSYDLAKCNDGTSAAYYYQQV
jgi:hypothetical protein